MRYITVHIEAILENYKGELPLAHFLKNYFRQHPILGSRDRRILTTLAYSWFRLAHGYADKSKLKELINEWLNEKIWQHTPLTDWITTTKISSGFDVAGLFPYQISLSSGIEKEAWLHSMLTQPQLFIRIRKDKGKLVSLLNGAGIAFTFVTDTCLSLPNGAKIDTLLPPDSYVVQDASSQQTGTFFHPHKKEMWYDCCSGAGGKSLLLKDLEPGVRLTITDKRESIIHNLQQRFRLYRHELPIAHPVDVADKAQLQTVLGTKQFDNIICDAPCSGSGTWSRTPEQLFFFDPATIENFASLQSKIATNVAGHLKPSGRLIYITCSVFYKENEAVVSHLTSEAGLKLQEQHLINGTSIHADSMFIAVLQKPGN
jgi:16S rRNA (cytosine967-C5)-methyltransferase